MSKAFLRLDGADFARSYNRRPFKIAHTLTDHPLLQLPRLVKLARTLEGSVLYFNADHAINQVDVTSGTPRKRTFVERGLARPNLSVTETVERIESANAWMQLRDVSKDPEYGQLLDALMAEFRKHAEPLAPGVTHARADIFVSSPGATTPFHLDEEHNFLLQIRGGKRLAIADGSNREVLSDHDLCEFYKGNGELAHYSERLEHVSVLVELGAGEGVHIPPCHPHWVRNGPAVSVSLGVLWHSDQTARQRNLYRVNELLRRLGVSPSSPGQQPLVDRCKTLPFALKRRVARAFSLGGR